MEKQVDVTLLPTAEDHFRRVRWMICDNGMTVADGTASYHPESAAIDWEEERPAAEYEGSVRLAIARAVETCLPPSATPHTRYSLRSQGD